MKGKKLLVSLLAAVVLVAVMVTPVMAATGTEITGTVPKAIEVSAPANFAMPELSPAATQPITSANQTATINANHTGWTLTVVDSDADGKMEASGPVYLTNAMLVKGGDETTYTSLASAVTLKSAGAAGTGQTITDISFQQTVSWGDAAGAYSITVTFTATPGS